MDGFGVGALGLFSFPGRLAAVRRRFERAGRRPGMDSATFATELGVLAMQGFDNMGERARGLMIRNKFIAAQPSRALRRHLDGASAEASMGDIVDSSRMWKSHTEDGYDGPDSEGLRSGLTAWTGCIPSTGLEYRIYPRLQIAMS